jgi:predicted PurR-regulated permease PerM
MSPDRGLWREIGSTLGHWLSAQMRICLILSVIYGIGFLLLRVPVWPILALMCGFSHAIPMFGAVVTVLIAAGLTWMERGFYPALGVMGIFAAAQALEGFYLSPRIMGRRLSLPPLWVFFGTLLASSLFGFFGILLAAPAMAVAVVIWRRFHRPS